MIHFVVYLTLLNGIISFLFRKKLGGKAYFLPALLALGQAGYSFYQAQQQKKKAGDLKDSHYIPPALSEAITDARTASNSEAPGFNRGVQKIQQSTASNINAAARVGGTAGQVQQAVADSDAREKETLKDLAVNNSAYKAQMRVNLNNLLMTEAGYQKQSYDALNAAKSALKGAASQNEFNAITTVGEGTINSLPGSSGGSINTSKLTDDSIIGKTGDALNKGIQEQANGSGTLTPEQIAYLKKIGITNNYQSGSTFNSYSN